MANHDTILYSYIILFDEVDEKSLTNSWVTLEIDEAYTIGKSIAVLKDGEVVGHLERYAARVVWRFLRSGSTIKAFIYSALFDRENKACYTIISRSYEIGVKIHFCDMTREDCRMLVAHFTRKKLNAFPGMSSSNCPENFRPLVSPVKDENGVSSLLFLALE